MRGARLARWEALRRHLEAELRARPCDRGVEAQLERLLDQVVDRQARVRGGGGR